MQTYFQTQLHPSVKLQISGITTKKDSQTFCACKCIIFGNQVGKIIPQLILFGSLTHCCYKVPPADSFFFSTTVIDIVLFIKLV